MKSIYKAAREIDEATKSASLVAAKQLRGWFISALSFKTWYDQCRTFSKIHSQPPKISHWHWWNQRIIVVTVLRQMKRWIKANKTRIPENEKIPFSAVCYWFKISSQTVFDEFRITLWILRVLSKNRSLVKVSYQKMRKHRY